MSSSFLDINAVADAFRKRAAHKGWQAYHTPKNLAAAVAVEAAELLEIFQWRSELESQQIVGQPETKEQVADEVADIIMYLTELCSRLDIDLVAAVSHKIAKNNQKD